MTGWKKGVFGALALLTGCVEALAASTGWTVPGKAAPEMEQPAVTIRLVSEKNALIPQAVNQMAVVIDQKNGWHTYWKMPGDAGFPTRFTFSLPQGLSATEPEYPFPERFDTAGIISYAFNGETLFPFKVDVPRGVPAGSRVTIKVEADYLACKDVCVPGHGEAEITLPYAVGADLSEDAPLIAKAKRLIPEKNQSLNAKGTLEGTNLVLSIPPSEVRINRSLVFYPLDANQFVLSDKGTFHQNDGTSSLYFTLTPEFSKTAPQSVRGVFVADGGPEKKGGWAIETTIPVEPGTVVRPLGDGESRVIDSTGSNLTLFTALGFAFLGGLILNLMPCVFPILSLKIVQLTESGRKGEALLPHGLAFTAGVVLSMLILSGVLIALRGVGLALGWGFQLQSSWVVTALLLLFTGITLNLLGVYEFTLGSGLGDLPGARSAVGTRTNSFITGILAVVVASPCTAPFMGAALGYALTRPSVEAMGIFASLGLGMALPWLLLCAFPSWTRWMPKPGPWMNTFKRVMAIPMLAAAAWLAWVLYQQLHIRGVAIVAAAVAALVVACWLYGRMQWGKGSYRLIISSLTVFMIGAVAAIAMGMFDRNGSGIQSKGSWEPWSEQAVTQALSEGRPVFVDFTAAWCITCQANMTAALNRENVQETLDRLGYVRLLGDWTNYDPAITRELEKYKRSGVPLYLVYRPNGQVTVLPELLTPGIVIEALEANARP